MTNKQNVTISVLNTVEWQRERTYDIISIITNTLYTMTYKSCPIKKHNFMKQPDLKDDGKAQSQELLPVVYNNPTLHTNVVSVHVSL